MTDIQTPVSSSPRTSPVAVETGPSASVGGVDGGQVVGPPHLPAVDLTRAEADLLAACEATIERGLRTFVETGSALADIRDNRLYRAEFPTFAVYCAQRWGLSAAHVNRLISKDAVAELISTPTGAKINERQARELAPLLGDPTELADVYAEAVNRSGGNPTAAVIREVRDERTTDTPASPPAPVAADENGPSSPPGGIDETSTDPRMSSVDPTAGSGAGKSAGPADPDRDRAALSEAITRYGAESPEAHAAELRMRLRGRLLALHGGITNLDVARVAEVADEALIGDLRRAVRQLTAFADAIDAARQADPRRRGHLRAV